MAFQIWVDADACPQQIKEIIFKTSLRVQAPVIMVANTHMKVPYPQLIQVIKVEQGADVADAYIVAHVQPGDLVITADIPLAALVVEKAAQALNPRGELYTAQNVKEILAYRNVMNELRGGMLSSGHGAGGGPKAFGSKDKELFANALDRFLRQRR